MLLETRVCMRARIRMHVLFEWDLMGFIEHRDGLISTENEHLKKIKCLA